jgi:hypothetical protein
VLHTWFFERRRDGMGRGQYMTDAIAALPRPVLHPFGVGLREAAGARVRFVRPLATVRQVVAADATTRLRA